MQKTLNRIAENRWTSRLLSPVILVLLVIAFSLATGGRFSNVRNLTMILEQALVVGTVATGAVFIFATGNVNISMGATTALVATIAAKAYIATGSVPAMFVVALISGVLIMALTALLSTWLNVRVLYVTVVMMTLLASIQMSVLGSSNIQLPYDMTSGMGDANVPLILFLIFFAFATVLFHFTALGRKLRYIGINDICAELTGFKKSRYLLIAFLVAGIGVGLGALSTIVRNGTITTDTCSTLNMDCMLAIVLGGMSCFGGSRSNTYSAIVGAVIVTVLNNGLLMLGVSNTILQAVRGVVFIILVCASQKRPQGLPSRDG
ncbi:MAG: ABC transporter permease [Subdoligranulum variabile]|nr:MAG: ABC transporter permease [Subdoligranulum variabile]